MIPLSCRTTYKGVTNGESKFEEFFFKPISIPRFFGKLEDQWSSGFIFGSRMPPPSQLLKPAKDPALYTNNFFNKVKKKAPFVYCFHWRPLRVEISTLASEANTNCWPEMFSVAYCTHIVHTKLMLIKNQIYTQKSMFTAIKGPTNKPLVVMVYL